MSTTFTNTGVGDGIIYGTVNFVEFGAATVRNVPDESGYNVNEPTNYGYVAVARIYIDAACDIPLLRGGQWDALVAENCTPGTTSHAITIDNLANGTQYWVRTYVNIGGAGEVGASIIYGPFTPAAPATTLSDVVLGIESITATVSRAAFQDRSDTMYADLRVYSDLACNVQVGLTAAEQFASGATERTVTVAGLTSGATYYIKTAVNAGDGPSSIGFSLPSGPYTLPIPVAQITSVVEGVVGGGQLSVVVSRAMFSNRTDTWSGVVRVYSNISGTELVQHNGEDIYAIQPFAEGEETVTVVVSGLTNDTPYYLRPAIAPQDGMWFGDGDVSGPYVPRAPTYFDTATIEGIETETGLASIPAAAFKTASAAQIQAMANNLVELTAEQIKELSATAVGSIDALTFGALLQAAKELDLTTEEAKPTLADVLTKGSVEQLQGYVETLTEPAKESLALAVATALEGYASKEDGGSKSDADKLMASVAALASKMLNAPSAIVNQSALLGTPVAGAPPVAGKTVYFVPNGTSTLTVPLTAEAIKIGANATFYIGTTQIVVSTALNGRDVTLNILNLDGSIANTQTFDKTIQKPILLGEKIMTNTIVGSTVLQSAAPPTINSSTSANGTTTFNISLNNTVAYTGYNMGIRIFNSQTNQYSWNTTSITETAASVALSRDVYIADGTYTINVKVSTTVSGTTYDTPFSSNYNVVVSPGTTAVCFLADAPVLTPAGYRPISSIKEGDLVRTAGGLNVAVKRVFRKEYVAGASVNPFVIPKGSFGALRSLPISPNHEVMTAKGMVQAKDLGLSRMKMAGSFTYYNLELEDWVRDNLVVAGVECESLAPAARVSMTKAEFGRFVKARYGPAAAARLRTVCFEEANGTVSMPAL